MTAPANKRRIHNDDARAASQKIPTGKSTTPKSRLRRSPYGARLLKARKAKEHNE